MHLCHRHRELGSYLRETTFFGEVTLIFLLSVSFSKHSQKTFILELGKEERLNSSSNFEQNFELTSI